MTASGVCPYQRDEETRYAWIAGRLDVEAAETFEQHMLECERCQRAVEDAMTLRVALRRPPRRASLQRGFWTVASIGVATAAVIVVVTSRAVSPLQRLGAVHVMPAFRGAPVRAAGDSVAQMASAAMAAYVADEYGRARDLLRRVAASDSTPGVLFFLGVAELRTGSVKRAQDALRRVALAGASPYAAEAVLYLAKSWLQLNAPDSALLALAAVASDAPAHVLLHAAALADSIRSIRRP